MIRELVRLALGYVVIKVKGPDPERLLNRLARRGIALWEVERPAPGMLIARMRASEFARVREIGRHQGWSIAIADKVGLPFLAGRLLRRRLLVLGALGALAALYVASGYVWYVEVQTKDELPVDRILQVAHDAGLRPGVRRDAVDRQAVQLALMLQVPEISWAAVNVEGTRAVIEAAERTRLDPALARPGDVVAARDGIVERITVLQGHALVRPGDTVRRGDILISGFIPPDEPRHRQLLEEGKAPYVRADGIVTARTWYEGRGRVRLVAESSRPTGRGSWRVELHLGGRSFAVGPGGGRFARVQEERLERGLQVGAYSIVVVYSRFREVEVERRTLSEAEALDLAREAALADLAARLPEGAAAGSEPPLVETALAEAGEGGPVAEARVRVELVQEIAEYRPLP